MKLGDIALVRSGLVLRRKEATSGETIPYQALNLRSIDPAGYIIADQLDVFNAKETLNPEYITRPGDIIVRLTAPYTAVLIDAATSGIVITSNFVVVRTDPEIILPDYLTWLLNTPHLKRQIFENATSNMLNAVTAKYYASLDIVRLPLADQHTIAELHRLSRREAQLLRELAEEKEKYNAQVIDAVQQDMRRNRGL